MLAVGIFLFTLFGILVRPFGFKIWVYSSIGAIVVLAFKLVDLSEIEAIFWLISHSTALLIALIIISFCLEALGFFEWLIFYSLKFCASKQNDILTVRTHRLFIAICILCALCSSILANDGAILILTPLILGIFLRVKGANSHQIIAFLFAVGFICDINSNALIISNLTNVITANFHHLDFKEFAKIMLLPNFSAFLCALTLFLLVFRKNLASPLNFRALKKPKLSPKLFIFYLVFLVCFVASFFISSKIHLPLSLNALIFALFLLIIVWLTSRKKAVKIIKNAPFGIILFVFGLFIVILALTKLDIADFVNLIFSQFSSTPASIFGGGLISSLCASVFNNLPTVLFANTLINDFFTASPIKQALIYANLLGANIGSKLTPIGSLCTLLWLALLEKRGVKISFKRYFSLSLIFTFPVLFCALFTLYLVL